MNESNFSPGVDVAESPMAPVVASTTLSTDPGTQQQEEPTIPSNHAQQAFSRGFEYTSDIDMGTTYDPEVAAQQTQTKVFTENLANVAHAQHNEYRTIESSQEKVDSGINTATEKIIDFVEKTSEKAKGFTDRIARFGKNLANKKAAIGVSYGRLKAESAKRTQYAQDKVAETAGEYIGTFAGVGKGVLETTESIITETGNTVREAMNWMDEKMLDVQHSIENKVNGFAEKVRTASSTLNFGLETASRAKETNFLEVYTKQAITTEVGQRANNFLINLAKTVNDSSKARQGDESLFSRVVVAAAPEVLTDLNNYSSKLNKGIQEKQEARKKLINYVLQTNANFEESRAQHIHEVTRGASGERAQWRDQDGRFAKAGEGRLDFSQKQMEDARKEMEADIASRQTVQQQVINPSEAI